MGYRHAIVMSDKPGVSSTRSDGCRLHEVRWNELPVDVAAAEIDGVIFDDPRATHTELPSVIATLPNVRWVSIEARSIAMLTPSALPRLADLVISGTTDVVMPKGPWPELRMLRAREAKVKLRADELPVLESAELRVKTKADLSEVGRLRRLRALRIGPVKADATVAALAELALTSLHFERGTIAELDGLLRWPKLETFGAFRCTGLKNVDALSKLKALRSVVFVGCRDHGGVLSKAVTKLRARGIDTELS